MYAYWESVNHRESILFCETFISNLLFTDIFTYFALDSISFSLGSLIQGLLSPFLAFLFPWVTLLTLQYYTENTTWNQIKTDQQSYLILSSSTIFFTLLKIYVFTLFFFVRLAKSLSFLDPFEELTPYFTDFSL